MFTCENLSFVANCGSRQNFCDLAGRNFNEFQELPKAVIRKIQELNGSEIEGKDIYGKLWKKRPESEQNLKADLGNKTGTAKGFQNKDVQILTRHVRGRS